MTDPTPHFGIGTVAGVPINSDYAILDEFDEATYSRYDSALRSMNAPTYRFPTKLVELNFHSYLNHEKFAGTLIGLGRNFGGSDHRPISESVMSQIINWLTSFRLYLDYSDTYLKRTFGRTSSQCLAFTRRKNEAYDQHVGYRFVYKFRNYVQHCGLPVSTLRLTRPEQPDANPFRKQLVAFLLNRDELLDNYDGWRQVRKDLLAMDSEFELRPLAEEAMEQLRAIDLVLLEIPIDEGARTVPDVREALGRIPPDAVGTPALFRFTTSGMAPSEVIQLTPQLFSREMVEQYERVASGQSSAGDLHRPMTPPAPPPFDPSTVREQFRRDSRAVQAISLWQAEKGGTRKFVAGVNRMIQEDGGPSILLDGMFNMTAILLNMTAAVLGVRPDGLLGGLLDVYAAQGDGPEQSTGGGQQVPPSS